jgi:hypothetical protein
MSRMHALFFTALTWSVCWHAFVANDCIVSLDKDAAITQPLDAICLQPSCCTSHRSVVRRLPQACRNRTNSFRRPSSLASRPPTEPATGAASSHCGAAFARRQALPQCSYVRAALGKLRWSGSAAGAWAATVCAAAAAGVPAAGRPHNTRRCVCCR